MEIISKITNPSWWIDNICNDLYFFCRNVLQILEDGTPGYKDLYYPTHKRMCDFVQQYAVEGEKVILLFPRGWLKSYLITVGWSAQRMVKNWLRGTREHEIISNATLPNAKEFLEKIKYNFAFNELFRGLFRKYIPENLENDAERWTQEELQLNGCKIETGSVEGNLVSRHYKIMIHDDLVNRDNSESALQLNKTKDWWKLAQSLLLTNGIEITIGTRWNFDDLYGYMIESFLRPEKNYHLKSPIVEVHRGKYHLLQADCWGDQIEEKKSTFPILFPDKKLKAIFREQGDRAGGQYRNDPLAKGINPIKREWFQRYKAGDIPEIVNTIMLIDPSGKARSTESSFSGMVVLDAGVDKKGYIRFGKRKLVTDLDLAMWTLETAMIYQPNVIGIEDTKFNVIQEMLELVIPQEIKFGRIPEEFKEYVRRLPYILAELKPAGRPKKVRVENLGGYIESGKFLFPYHGAEDLIDEAIKFPASIKDDIVDAFGYVFDVLSFPQPSDPKKLLIVPESLKISDKDKEQKEWEEIKEAAILGGSEWAEEYEDIF